MQSRSGALAGFRVLVVEDDLDSRELLTLMLRYFGAFVTSAADATTAIESVQRFTPDVVVTGMFLADHDAEWMVRQARASKITTPFIAVWPIGFDVLQLEPDGFRAFLRQPVHHGALVDAILASTRSRGA